MIRKLFLTIALALLLVACDSSKNSSQQPVGEPARSGDTPAATTTRSRGADTAAQANLFARIDAQTPWLYANLEPMPDALTEKSWAVMEAFSETNRDTYQAAKDDLGDEPLLLALMDELLEITSIEAMHERGLAANGLWAVHAVSLYPFMHWQLTDATKFRAMLDRVEEKGETEFEWQDIAGAPLLWLPVEELGMGLALSYDDHYLSLALIPANERLLRRVANVDQPAQSYTADTLRQFAAPRSYLDYGSGFMENGRILDLLFDGEDELLAALREGSSLGEIAADAACREELGALVRLFPRLTAGYTRADARQMDVDITLEMEPGFAKRLSAVADTPVGLAPTDVQLLDFGFAINLVAARDLAREIVGGWVETPPRCSLFSNLADSAASMQAGLNQPIPPMVTNLYGLRALLDSFSLDEDGSPTGTGAVAAFMHNPEMILGFGQMFSPELASLELKPNGKPQPVPAGLIPGLPENLPAWAAMGKIALGVAAGADHKDRLANLVQAGKQNQTILIYGLDFQGYASLMASMMESLPAEATESVDTQSMAQAMELLGKIYRSTYSHLDLLDRGARFDVTIELVD